MRSSVFSNLLAECGRALAPFVDWSSEGVLRGDPEAPSLERVDVVQPVLFACDGVVGLDCWLPGECIQMSWLVIPSGRDRGGICRGCAVVVGRGTGCDSAQRALVALAGEGGMVSVAASREEVGCLLESCGGTISIAAVNGPRSVVVSGDDEALDELLRVCGDEAD